MIFHRAMQVAFISMRIIRSGRFRPRIAGTACLVAGVLAAVVFPPRSAVAEASAAHTSPYSQTIIVTSLSDTGAGSLRAAINSANAAPAGNSTLIRFGVNGTITLASPLPAIVRKVTIDATSAPTHVSGGPPVVALDCNRHPGLLFSAGSAGSQLLGVAVDDANGNGVTLDAG